MKIEPEDPSTIKQLLYGDEEPKDTAKHKRRLVDLPEGDKMEILSRTIWVSNPGYIPQHGVKSVVQEDYVWDEAEIEHMKSLGHFAKQFNRKRDSFTKYVEAEAQFKKLSKSQTS